MHENHKGCVPSYILNSKTYFAVTLDLNANYTFVNDAFQNRFSYVTDNFIGKSALIIIPPDDYKKCIETVKKCFTTPNETHEINLSKLDEDGTSYTWTTWEFSLVKDKNNKPTGIICIGHDNSALKNANDEAQKFASKVNTILEEITEGFYQIDSSWKLVKMNRTAASILNVDRDKVIFQNIFDLCTVPADTATLDELKWALKENQTVTFEKFFPYLNKWILTTAYPSPEGLTVFIRDVTEQQLSKATLQFSETKLKAVLDSTNDSIIVVGPDLKIIDFNKAAAHFNRKIFNKKLEIGSPIYYFLSKENLQLFNDAVDVVKKGATSSYEIQENINDQATWFEISFTPVFDEDKSFTGITIHSKNIEERKQAELKISEQEYMLRAIYHSTSEASTFIDDKMIIRYMNQIARDVTKRVFGIEAKIGDDAMIYVRPEYQDEFRNFYMRALAGIPISVERSEGDNWWHLLLNPVYDNEHKIIGISHIIKDITTRKIREVKLQESEEKLQKNMEAIPHPLLIVNERGEITFVNAEFEQIFGYAEVEIIGQTIDFLATNEYKRSHTHLFNEYLRIGGKSKPLGHYLFAQAKDGKQIVIDARLNSFTAGNQRFVIMILQDVTKMKRHQDTILRQNKKLKSIAWQQSHEVRRPLANIMGMYTLLKENATSLKGENQKYLEHLLKSTEELDKIIHEIVADSNSENGFSEE